MHPSLSLDWTAVTAQLSRLGYQGESPSGPFWLGDSPELSEKLNALVVSGQKAATASLLWEWEHDGDALPLLGQTDLLLSWDNELVGVIRTTDVVFVPFGRVKKDFARLEGEGDLSLTFWREAHWTYFKQVCKRIAREPTQDMLVVCQRFAFRKLEIRSNDE